MLTVLEAINLSASYLEKKNVESPRLNAEILLAEILKCKRIDLYLSFDRPLKEAEVNSYREFIRRRGNHEPLQYIIGKVNFFELELIVNPSVLIPRPETELLVSSIIDKYKFQEDLKILDIGTGSGNIAIALAKNLFNCKVDAIDISDKAIELAKQNSILNEVDDKINFTCADIFLQNYDPESYDVVVSNPPYISLKDYHQLEPNVLNYEPKNALTDELEGESFYSEIIQKAKSWLKQDGAIYFELGYDKRKFVEEKLISTGFSNIKVIKDYQQIDRVISGEKIWKHWFKE